MKLPNPKKIIFFTNIVAPYRVFLFNKLEEVRSKNTSFDFEVYFMRHTEADRNWEVILDDLKFKHLIGNGFYLRMKHYHLHFNPILILKLIRSKREIVLGSSWNDLNVLFIALLKSLGLISNKLSVWSEANYLTNNSQKENKSRDRLRKWFFSQIDGSFIVPGHMSTLSFEKWEIPVKNVVILPNLVSRELFEKEGVYQNDTETKPNFFMVARLEESVKGIRNFLESIGNENVKKIVLRIAGTGSSLDNYLQYIKINNLEENVFLIGNLSQEEISLEYKKANIFVLPSFSDPSPLTIVEAIFSGLPVFVSERCGNHFEVVVNGENGYTFNPNDPNDIKNKFENLLSERNNWGEFSDKSVEIAFQNFQTENILNNFIKFYAE